MNSCRICRTKTNLKYVPEQLAKARNNTNVNEELEIMEANASILGNICLECEERLINFHKLDEPNDFEADSGREETPVIVDDDYLLYNQFFENSKQIELQLKLERPKNSLSSDCDTDIVELQSSREISPNLEERIVAFIDLSADETLSCTTTDANAVAIPSKKRKRHRKYDDNQLVLLGTLNLVSSDSETDGILPPAKRATEKTSVAIENNNVKNEIISTQKIAIKHELPLESNVDEGVKCNLCQLSFDDIQALVHHIRLRHRDNEEETKLRERMRFAQDSALTIRLCYQGRLMFYECQMCGRIDSIFKEHKEHVIAKHSAELISLKDPLLKSLTCPICQKICGSLYIEVCRHLLQAHTFAQYNFYMKEITCHQDEPLKSVALTARMYKLHDREQLYFLCRQCDQLSRSISSHTKHVANKHSNSKVAKVDLQVQQQPQQQQQQPQQQQQEIVRSLRIKEKTQINVATTETIKTVRQRQKPMKLNDSTSDFLMPRIKERKSNEAKEKLIVKKSIATSVTKRGRGRPPATDRLQRVRIKVKPTIKQIAIQSYKCHYCQHIFKGFLLWNLHILKDHSDNIKNDKALLKKVFEVKMHTHKSVHKRKRVALSNADENIKTEKSISMEKSSAISQLMNWKEIKEEDVTPNVPNWEEELWGMNEESENEDKEILLSSGLMEMKPNIAIMEQTSNIRCIKKYNITTNAT